VAPELRRQCQQYNGNFHETPHFHKIFLFWQSPPLFRLFAVSGRKVQLPGGGFSRICDETGRFFWYTVSDCESGPRGGPFPRFRKKAEAQREKGKEGLF
jgi:hypothetical protein